MPDQNQDQNIPSDRLTDVLGLLGAGGLAKGAGMALAKSPAALGILKLVPRGQRSTIGMPSNPLHSDSYDLLNEGAGRVGMMNVDYTPRNQNVHVGWIESHTPSPYEPGTRPWMTNPKTWSLGPENMKSIVEELMKKYPEAKTGSAQRISGARNNYGIYNYDNDLDWTNPTEKVVKRTLPGRE